MTEIAGGSSTAGQPPATPDAGVTGEQPKTVEEVEAIWRNRVSGKDRAHAAEVEALQRQLEAARNPQAPSASETPEQARIKELERALQQREQQVAVADRRARFPHAAETLGEDIATLTEPKLAALEATLAAVDAAPPPRMDPNAAQRGQPTPPKSLDQMSKEELLSQLEALSGPYAEALRNR